MGRQTLPSLDTVLFGYDANGNLDAIAPPGQPAHGLTYSGRDQETLYAPPAPGGGAGFETVQVYDADAALDAVGLPGGVATDLDFTYDPATAPRLRGGRSVAMRRCW